VSNFVDANVINVFNTTIDKLREDIGRNVTIIGKPIERSCPNCGYDPINKASNNKYEPESPYPSDVEPTGPINFPAQGMRKCPICSGKGRIVLQATEDSVLCLISPLTKEEAEKTQLGKNFIINYELSARAQYKELFMNSNKVVVDGHVCDIISVSPVGIGTLTQLQIYAGGGV
jgi:hypothetical protein